MRWWKSSVVTWERRSVPTSAPKLFSRKPDSTSIISTLAERDRLSDLFRCYVGTDVAYSVIEEGT